MPETVDVEKLSNKNIIELYVKPDCPYCAQAQAFYDARGVKYETHDAQNDRAMRKKMLALTRGDPTVPAIVVDGSYVQSGWGKPPRG
jgi:glutaredoxin